MENKKDKFANIVSQTIVKYDEFRCDPVITDSWNPLNSNIIDYHCRQLESLGSLLSDHPIDKWDCLDFGCGSGRLIRDLIEFGVQPTAVKGIEIEQSLIDTAYHYLPRDIFYKFDGLKIPFPNESFNLVCQSTVLSSIKDEDFRHHLCDELLRVTKKGGYIFWWDKITTVDFVGNQSLEIEKLFKNSKIRKIDIRRKPLPGENIRKLKGLGSLIGLLTNRLSFYPITHLAALIGPKQ